MKYSRIVFLLAVYLMLMPLSVYAAGWETQEDGSMRYVQDNGDYLTNVWIEDKSQIPTRIYYLGDNGKTYRSRWLYLENVWYYFGTDGVRIENNWVSYHDNWYYLGQQGHMQTGWGWIDGKWYFFAMKAGEMQTGFLSVDGADYCFNSDGSLFTGEKEYNGTVYRFGENGIENGNPEMAIRFYGDGRRVNAKKSRVIYYSGE